ncbi:MAG: molecular chaperone DnaJ [Acidimicrobiales bacterium]
MTAAREWFEKDYYKLLGVASDATAKEVTAAYRKLARSSHPDANPGDAQAEERFKELSSAYDVIGDPAKRAEYDEIRRLGPVGPGGFGGTGGFGNPRINLGDRGDGDLGDLFTGLFNRQPRRRPPGSAGATPGRDLEAELHLSFLDAAQGVTTSVGLVSDVVCGSCAGAGTAPGTVAVRCERCAGRGLLDDNQGFFSFSQPCPDCRGVGRRVETPCVTCAGAGLERRARDVKVRVPAGVEDSQRIRLAGRGEPGRAGGPAGDLLVTVRVSAHERFGRRGADLTLTLPISYPEAVLGGEIRVPTLQGEPLTLRVPPGTRSGRTFRVRGRGIEAARGVGDLLVTVEIAVPTNPSARERKLLEDLALIGAASAGGPSPSSGRVTPPGSDPGPAGSGEAEAP